MDWEDMSMRTYDVVVGNIGTVHSGRNQRVAMRTYRVYVEQSRAAYGRAAGENVTVMCDSEIHKEYIGSIESTGGDTNE